MSFLDEMHQHLVSIDTMKFKTSSIFTNSLLKTHDTTQIIRDIRDEEIVFFKGKKMQFIDYELMNSLGVANSNDYVQYEITNLLDSIDKPEIDDGSSTPNNNLQKIDFNKFLIDNSLSEITNDEQFYLEFKDDILELFKFYKHSYTVKNIWASNNNNNMLDSDTNELLNNLNKKIDMIINSLKEIWEIHQNVKLFQEKIDNSYEKDV